MPLATHNCNGKIWVFTNQGFDLTVMSNTNQQITFMLHDQTKDSNFYVTIVYAKCDVTQRLELWDEIYSMANGMNFPWIIGGDFNVVLGGEEKIEGLHVVDEDSEDFRTCIESCGLTQVQFKGSPFTWWNGRTGRDCIFERLDRVLVNSVMFNMGTHSEVEHLPRTGSDHAPLLLICEDRTQRQRKPFRFLNFWTEHDSFKEVVRHN